MSNSIYGNGFINLTDNVGAGSNIITLTSPELISNTTIILPDSTGISDQVLNLTSPGSNTQWFRPGVLLSWKHSVHTSSVGNVTLSPSPAFIDDVAITEYSTRVLLKQQSVNTENGIYIKNSSGDLVRSNDAKASQDASGTVIYVIGGSTNADKIYYCTDLNGTVYNSGITYNELDVTLILTGPNTSTNFAAARFDGTTGSVIKDSSFIIDDSGNVTVQSGNIDMSTKDIILSSTSSQSITHTGSSGQNLVISSGGFVKVEDFEFENKAMRFAETNGGAQRISLVAPSDITPSNYTILLPPDIGTVNQVLRISSIATDVVTTVWDDQIAGPQPAGTIGSVQYNGGGGNFAGSDNFSWDNGSQILTLNASVIGVTTLDMSGDLTNSSGNILLSDINAVTMTHTGSSGQNLIISSGSDVLVESVTFSNNSISGVSTLDMSGDLTNSSGNILLSDINAVTITHTGSSGQNLIISSGSDVLVESVTFANNAISGVSTLDMTGNLESTTGGIDLTNSSSQSITHTGSSGQNLIISSGSDIQIQSITLSNAAVSGVSTLDMTGNLTNSAGGIDLTDSSSQSITHTGGGGDLTISSISGDVVIENVTFSNGIVSGVGSIGISNDLTITTNDINFTSSNAQNITHTGSSGQNLIINSGSDVIVNGVTFSSGDIFLTNMSITGTLSFTNTNVASISHTGGSGNLVISSGGNVTVESAIFDNQTLSNIGNLSMTGSLINSSGNINLQSSSAKSITHTGQVGQNLSFTSGSSVDIQSSVINDNDIISSGVIRTNKSLILEDSGIGTNTITIKAIPSSSYTMTFPDNDGTLDYLLEFQASGDTEWVSNPNTPGGADTNIQFNNSGSFGGSPDFTWDYTNKIFTIGGKMLINDPSKTGTPSITGTLLSLTQQTYTDNTGSATTNAVFVDYPQHTLEASSSTTTTNAATVYIEGAPLTGINQTITNSYALWVDNDDVKIDNNLESSNITSLSIVSTSSGNSLTDGTIDINTGVITNINTATATTANVTTVNAGGVSLSGAVLTGLSAPTLNDHVSTKLYADTNVQGNIWAISSRLTTTGNITLSGNQTIDGVATAAGDRVLVKEQSTLTENGIYDVVDPGAWTRTADFATGLEARGHATLVTEGSTLAGAAFVCNSPASNDTVDTDDILFAQFTAANNIIDGDGLIKIGNVYSINVDNSTLRIFNDNIEVKDSGITTSKILNNSITTVKIANNQITNLKILNTDVTVIAGDGLQNGGSVDLGNSVTLNIDATVLKTTGDQTATGVQNFDNTTGSINTTTGSVVISGGLGIGENFNPGGIINVSGLLRGSSGITDTVATLSGGALTSIGLFSITGLNVNGTIISTGGDLTDTVMTLDTSHDMTSVVNITSTGLMTASSITNGTATLTGGVLSGIADPPTSGTQVSSKNYADSFVILAGSGLTKIGTVLNLNVDDITMRIFTNNKVRVKNLGISSAKLDTNSVTNVKIVDNNITNVKLAFKSFSITAGDGLQGGGSVINLGNSTALSVDNTVLRTTGEQIASGLQIFTNITESGSVGTGAILIDGGLGIAENLNIGGNLFISSGNITGNIISDGTATLTGGNFTGLTGITASSLSTTSTITGNNSLTDSTATLSGGDFTGLGDVTASGNITSSGGSFTDSTAILSGGVLTNLNAPSLDTDVTNKTYVDGQAFGTTWVAPARVATTGDVDISTGGLLTIDTVSLVLDNRVLLKNQSIQTENGVYLAKTGSWVRTSDMSTGSAEDFSIFIEEGIVNFQKSFIVTGDLPYIIGSSNLVWTKFASSGELVDGAGLTKTGNLFDVNVDGVFIEVTVGPNQLALIDNSITTVKIDNNSVTTDKIQDNAVTNLKLLNSDFDITAGTGLDRTPPSGVISLGGSITFSIDNSILRTDITNSTTGRHEFTNVTNSGSTTTGAIVITGGLGVVKNVNITGSLNATGTITSSSSLKTVGGFDLTLGAITGVGDIEASKVESTGGTIQGNTIGDGITSFTGGNFINLVDLTLSGLMTTTSLSDGVSTWTGDTVSGVVTPVDDDDASNKQYVDDNTAIPRISPNSGLTKVGTELRANIDGLSIEVISGGLDDNKLGIKDGNATDGITGVKLGIDSVISSKFQNNSVTNAKLASSSFTINSTTLTNVGSLSLGATLTPEIDTTQVMVKSGGNTASGVQNYTNTTNSTSAITGAMIITGGLGIEKSLFSTGDIECVGTVQGVTVGDGVMSFTGGNLTGGVTINCQDSNNGVGSLVEGLIVTDTVASLNDGDFTNLINITASGNIDTNQTPGDAVLFTSNGNGRITNSANITWDGTVLEATQFLTQNITRTGASVANLWTTGTGDITFGAGVTGTIQFGLGPMFKLDSNESVLKSSLTILGNLSRAYTQTIISQSGNRTYTAGEVYDGFILRECTVGSNTDTFPTAQDITNIIPEAVAGSSVELIIKNTSTNFQLLSLQEPTGGGTLTFDEQFTIAAGITSRYLIVMDDIIFSQWSGRVFASVPKDRIFASASFRNAAGGGGGGTLRYAQWASNQVSNSTIDYTVFGFSGVITQYIVSYSHQNPISISGVGTQMEFDLGLRVDNTDPALPPPANPFVHVFNPFYRSETINNSGTGYTTSTWETTTVLTGSGDGALTVSIEASGGNITSVTVLGTGSGYAVGDTFQVDQTGSGNNSDIEITAIQGKDLIIWDDSFNNTFPSTSTLNTQGVLSIRLDSSDKIASRSLEVNNISPNSMELRCSITFSLD